MNNIDYQNSIFKEIAIRLESIDSIHPYQLLFYGSKFRGDDTDHSDYNFYLIASPTDQLQSKFIQEISDTLEIIDTNSSIGLIAGDFDSLKYRLKICEPTAIHLCEFSQSIYGENLIGKLQEEWNLIKQKPIDRTKIISYTENRSKFYRNLRPKTTKEEINRIEKVISLNMQIWIFKSIPDLTPTEICFLDIPYRLIALVKTLYKNDLDDNMKLLTEIYKEIHELKQSIRMSAPYSEENLNRIKESVQSIQGLSNTIVKN